MNLKKLVLLSATSIGMTMLASAASATTYVSAGTSFASISTGFNPERGSKGTFESFTRSIAAHPSIDASSPDGNAQEQSRGVTKEDTWLMLLISGVLVAVQLRRKQKSLPHQPFLGATTD